MTSEPVPLLAQDTDDPPTDADTEAPPTDGSAPGTGEGVAAHDGDPGADSEELDQAARRTRVALADPERTDPQVTVPDAEHTNWRWRAVVQSAGPAVVVDMDGVVSDASERQHFLRDGRRDWDGFFAACGEDTPIEEVTHLLRLLAPELQVVLLTARPTRVQPQTLEWLARHRLRWDLLVMRPDGDRVPSEVYKRRSVHELRARGFDLQLAFEDDQVNRRMLIDEGIPCVYIHSGYYER